MVHPWIYKLIWSISRIQKTKGAFVVRCWWIWGIIGSNFSGRYYRRNSWGIVDEIDTPQQQFKLNSQNKIIAEGNQNVKDLYKEFNLELPEIESSTIGGYIMDLAKKIPLYGEITNDKYFNYKVISHSRKQILRVEISQIN